MTHSTTETSTDFIREQSILKADEGKLIRVMDNQIIVKLTGENTNGAYSLSVYSAPPGYPGPPLHRHAFDEFFYVLGGELTITTSSSSTVVIKSGDSVFVPGGTAHTYSNTTREAVTFQLIVNPPGFEQFFEDVAKHFEANGQLDMNIMAELNRQYGVEFVAP